MKDISRSSSQVEAGRFPAGNKDWGRALLTALLAGMLTLMTWAGVMAGGDPIFAPLARHLRAAGFSGQEAKGLLADPGLKFEAKTLARMLGVREYRLNYRQFLRQREQNQARRFMKKHAPALASARASTKVDPQVVVAILMVETRLGRYTGSYRTLNVLASQAVLDQTAARQRLVRYWPRNSGWRLNSRENRARFKKRARWARGELAALLRLAQKHKLNISRVKGSPAGALGMAQFMPSNILRHGVDADRNGMVDLDKPRDAIFSVANYLKNHGWRPGLSPRAQLKVIMRYNQSVPYAKAVLELARSIG